jgi:hypothetical protein
MISGMNTHAKIIFPVNTFRIPQKKGIKMANMAAAWFGFANPNECRTSP